MRLREIMHNDLGGISPSGSLVDAISQLQKRDGEPLPVYEQGQLVGILTERDVISWHASGGGDPKLARVVDAMSQQIPSVYEDEDVQIAAQKLKAEHLDGLLVVKKNRQPVGIVSAADLAASGPSEVLQGRIMLQPIAAPSILGLYGFAGATFIVATNMAGWYGNDHSANFLFPFAAFFGGLAQFTAGMWAYKARDAIATAMHGLWGAFWMGYGLLYLLFATGVIVEPHPVFTELGFWFIALGAITAMGAIAALGENLVLFAVLGTLAAGSIVAACAFISGTAPLKTTAGWLFVIAAIFAWYLASAMMFEASFKRVILPLGKYSKAANTPGSTISHPVQFEQGQSGVKVGQ
ncbi:MAG TPA: GPR1/FUN34/YaaH family transporter [Tepidisphaeraceae bacterium]